MLVGVPSPGRAASVLTTRSSRAQRAGGRSVLALGAARERPFVGARHPEVVLQGGLDRSGLDACARACPRQPRRLCGFLAHDVLCRSQVSRLARERQRHHHRERRPERRHQRCGDRVHMVAFFSRDHQPRMTTRLASVKANATANHPATSTPVGRDVSHRITGLYARRVLDLRGANGQESGRSSRPRPRARSTASARELTSSLRYTAIAWVFTVLRDTKSSSAI